MTDRKNRGLSELEIHQRTFNPEADTKKVEIRNTEIDISLSVCRSIAPDVPFASQKVQSFQVFSEKCDLRVLVSPLLDEDVWVEVLSLKHDKNECQASEPVLNVHSMRIKVVGEFDPKKTFIVVKE